MHSMSRYYRYINQNTPTTLTHTTTTTFSDPLSADFTNTHAHERSLREVNFTVSPQILLYDIWIEHTVQVPVQYSK